MNELIGHTTNIALVLGDHDQIEASVEMVLLVSEPRYKADTSGLNRTREITDFRFAITVDSLREMAKVFAGIADDAEALQNRVSLTPQTANKLLELYHQENGRLRLSAAANACEMDELIAVADTAQALLSERHELDTLRHTLTRILEGRTK